MLSPASMANYRKNLDSNYYNNDNNDNSNNNNDDDSDDNENNDNDNDNDSKIVYDGNLVRSIRFTLESAVESLVTMLPFNEGSDGFVIMQPQWPFNTSTKVRKCAMLEQLLLLLSSMTMRMTLIILLKLSL